MKIKALLVILCCVATQGWAQPVDYSGQIQPIFDKYCVECHSGWFPQGGLRLDTLENLNEGGTNGRVLIPGEPDKGRLVNMIRSVPGRFTIMPPGPQAVTAAEFELIRSWIEQGAR